MNPMDWRRELKLEIWVVKALRHFGHAERDFFCGVTTREIRRDRLRTFLIDRQLGDTSAGKVKGEPKTWAQVFELLYGEPLVIDVATKEAA